jgi:molybdate transport system ATP-binding protein
MIDINITKALHGAHGAMELHLNTTIQQGEFVALTGKSGSGKTTLLRILAGLEKAEGKLLVEETLWLDAQYICPPQQREIGFVFQDYALFENMTIEQNLLFVAKDKTLAQHLLEVTELSSMKNRYPKALSGGQKQRVALCRALMKKPKLLLLDEPFSALDGAMREKLQKELLTLHKEFHTTTIMVTHNKSEMYQLASRLIVLENGKVVQDATPQELLFAQEKDKLKLHGKVVEIVNKQEHYSAIIALGQQLVEITLTHQEAQNLTPSQEIILQAGTLHLNLNESDTIF